MKKSKKVIITGASSGIGLQLLKMFLVERYQVFAVSLNMEELDLEDENLTKYSVDLSKKDAIDDMFDKAMKTLLDVDIFIANAGFTYYEELLLPNWQHVENIFKTNVFSVIYSAEKLKQIKGDKHYQFVVTASGMSFVSMPGYALYSSTKAALKGFVDAYRYELADNQNIIIVYPIATTTDFFAKAGNIPVPWPSQKAEQVANAIYLGIVKNKKKIFPSKIFCIMLKINNIIPIVIPSYLHFQNKIFKKWAYSNRNIK